METFAAKSILLHLTHDLGVVVDSITTDRSTTMRTMILFKVDINNPGKYLWIQKNNEDFKTSTARIVSPISFSTF